MLHLLDAGLEAFLRAEVPLPRRQVDLSFDAPDHDWGASVTRPTVNLFLWDVRTNVDQRHAGTELVEGEDGRRHRRPPKPRMDCHYLVTAWTTEVRDQHQLLGAVLATLLTIREVDPKYLPDAYAAVRPLPTISVAEPDGRDQSDFWSALGGQLKAGLDLVVTATLDSTALAEAGPPVERIELTLTDPAEPDRTTRTLSVGGHAEGRPGGTPVRTPRGHAATDSGGDFLVRAEPGDEVVVEGQEPVKGTVPQQGGVEFPAGGERAG